MDERYEFTDSEKDGPIFDEFKGPGDDPRYDELLDDELADADIFDDEAFLEELDDLEQGDEP